MKLFKKLNKGFTLVELVVVIAVIAILSAVSVVAYTSITNNARKTTAMSNARTAYEAYLVEKSGDDEAVMTFDIVSEVNGKSYYFAVTDGQFNAAFDQSDREAAPNYTIGDNGELVPPAEPEPENP